MIATPVRPMAFRSDGYATAVLETRRFCQDHIVDYPAQSEDFHVRVEPSRDGTLSCRTPLADLGVVLSDIRIPPVIFYAQSSVLRAGLELAAEA